MSFGTEKLEWLRYPIVKKFWRYFYSFWHNSRTWQTHTDRQTPHDGVASRGENASTVMVLLNAAAAAADWVNQLMWPPACDASAVNAVSSRNFAARSPQSSAETRSRCSRHANVDVFLQCASLSVAAAWPIGICLMRHVAICSTCPVQN